MAYGKFAPMTSELLARKAEAEPSIVAAKIGPNGVTSVKVGFFDTELQRGGNGGNATRPKSKKKQTKQAGTTRRVALTLTPDEFERLGIAAIKKKMTRQELLRSAVSRYIAKTAGEFENCNCISQKKITGSK
jgi:hypothetical protein